MLDDTIYMVSIEDLLDLLRPFTPNADDAWRLSRLLDWAEHTFGPELADVEFRTNES